MRLIHQLGWLAAAVRDHPLTGRAPWAAWGRFAWWQFRSRFVRRTMTVPFVNGTRLTVIRGRPISTAVWYFGLPDYDEMLFALHLLRPGDLFVDGGANVGVWSILAASTGADVIAVEPVRDTFDILTAQVALNDMGGRITCRRCALGAARGELHLTTDLDAGNHVVADPATGLTEAVPAEPLDHLRADRRPTLIKLDLEGHELPALTGAAGVLADPTLLGLVVETFRPDNWETPNLRAIEGLLAAAGFHPVRYEPGRRSLTALTKPNEGGQNTIYVRDTAAVRRRLESAPPVTLAGARIDPPAGLPP
jgi:FkbM family methyltransferase